MGIYKYTDKNCAAVELLESVEIYVDKYGPTYVYYLVDARDNPPTIRYVGVAHNPIHRYEEHCSMSRNGNDNKHDKWARSFWDSNERPHMILVGLYSRRTVAQRAEGEHIRALRAAGHCLVNSGRDAFIVNDDQSEEAPQTEEGVLSTTIYLLGGASWQVRNTNALTECDIYFEFTATDSPSDKLIGIWSRQYNRWRTEPFTDEMPNDTAQYTLKLPDLPKWKPA